MAPTRARIIRNCIIFVCSSIRQGSCTTRYPMSTSFMYSSGVHDPLAHDKYTKRVYVGNCKFRFSDIKGDTPDFSLISRCRNLDNHLFALIIPIRGFKKKYSIADIMVKSRYALRYQGAVALISRISTQLSALLPPRPIFPTKPVLPNSELILHTKGSLYYLP